MKAVIPIFLIAIVAGVAAFIIIDPFYDRAAAYKAENERLLTQFSPPPVAKVVSSEQRAYESEGIASLLNRAKGWTLTVVYGVPEAVTADDVVAWYRDKLPSGWTEEIKEAPGGANPQTGQPNPPLRTWIAQSGSSRVAINLDKLNPAGQHTYEVSIDHKGAEHGE